MCDTEPGQDNPTPETKSTIWDALNEWGTPLVEWQRFILAHAIRDVSLEEARVGEAYRLFLRCAGLDNGLEALAEVPASLTGSR